MKKYSFNILLSLFLALMCAFAEDDASKLQSAVNMYEQGNWSKALEIFQHLNDTYQKADLCLYIGNCHVNLEDYSQALKWYFKGLRLESENAELKHNIRIVREKLGLPANTQDLRSITGVFFNLISHFSLDTHRLLWMLLYAIICGVMAYALGSRSKIWVLKIPLIILMGIWVFQGYVVYLRYVDSQVESGIVMRSNVPLRYGPSLKETQILELPQGIYFKVLGKTEGGWYSVLLEDGKKGWLKVDDVLFI